jgi:hypothetical protein
MIMYAHSNQLEHQPAREPVVECGGVFARRSIRQSAFDSKEDVICDSHHANYLHRKLVDRRNSEWTEWTELGTKSTVK